MTDDDVIPDMTEIQYMHCPQLAFRQDISSPIAAFAVGWLGAFVPRAGTIPASAFSALRQAHARCATDAGELGYHTCRICNRYDDRGEFIVEVKGRTYVLPRMVLHYIEVHGYCPPVEFLEDLATWKRKSQTGSEDET